MDMLSTEQRCALERAQRELQQAGLGHLLQPSMLLPTSTSASASALPSLSSSARPTAAMEHPPSDPTPTGLFSASRTLSAPAKLLCSPAPARPFTAAEKAANGNVIHRKARVDALAIHPPQTTVEYPETGLLMGQRIAHLFSVDPERYVNPRHSFQFSFDKGHGGQASATCLLLTDANGSSISCSEWHGTCSSVKTCSFAPIASDAPPPRIPALPTFDDAEKRLFLSSFGFYCALLNRGCTFSSASGHAEDESDAGDCEDFSAANQEDHPLAGDAASRGPRAPCRSTCPGKLRLWANDDGKYFVSCSLRREGARGHLFLYGVEQYDVGYLKALFSDDHDSALAWERRAEQGGYGPLARCNRLASPSSQAYWSDWHRRPGFALERALMVAHSDCPAKCEVYVPHNLQLCPSVLVVCSNPHSHPLPPPTNTPPLVRRVFEGMLRSLDWQMADITPRRLVLNSRFMHHLRTALGWSQYRNPQLSDLHPSLGNFDHTSYLIGLVRNEVFPKGTGFNASVYQLVRETSLGRSERYVRVAESAQVNGATFRFVICMYPEQSEILRQAKRLTADAAFKRVVGWKEFELETWDDSGLRSITCARVFMTALSADAHLIVLKRIYQLVLEDCGAPWQFAYLHGAGTDTATSDQDNAEALAFGKFAQWIASSTLTPSNVLCTLTPYQHLAHFYTLCLTHHKRNLTPYKNKVTPSVFHAMQSLASAEPLPDINAVIATIRAGGKAAADWIDNKLVGDSWALRALYQPWSKIPLHKWKAAPRTTNGNEQAHHNVNLDGTRLSLLAGVMHGAEFDRRVLEGRRAVAETGVQTRFKVSDEFHRAERRLTRQVRVNDKILAISDAAMETEHAALKRLDEQQQRQVNILSTVSASSTTASSARKRLREISEQLPQQEDRVAARSITLAQPSNICCTVTPRHEAAIVSRRILRAHGLR
ncbi:hypothetical protein EXIGLDRAFT_758968 [Exidia glandulosa HHB12029]|uniref:Uncharacterized protein n=1 Tax=Exidia glandulosa HHB12029 TaxID=1314781 RepID=A0A165QHI4_EXIGL|nr:hypothetical protein EXIGLDRAFT_758968 [Exidia glandulosa HHB12029]